ncbi:membrane protein [Pseudomonas phage Dolphis]|nr:membrane protein [Pseudomonas phage Dolphis]
MPYRIAAAAAALAIAAGLGAAGGAVVATWRADAKHAGQVQELTSQIDQLKGEKHALELGIAEQNKGVAVAEAQTRAAEQAQAQAQQHAADLAAFSESRMKKLEGFMADTADQVLKAYWELRK